jgi:hypothetical protein
MKLSLKTTLTALGVISLLALGASCGNTQQQIPEPEAAGGCQNDASCEGQVCLDGACVDCRVDKHCQGESKCRECSSNQCVDVDNCCTTDTECGDDQRCWNVKRKAYGQCGAK